MADKVQSAVVDELLELVSDVVRSDGFILRSRCGDLEALLAHRTEMTATVVSAPAMAVLLTLTALNPKTIEIPAGSEDLRAIAARACLAPPAFPSDDIGAVALLDLKAERWAISHDAAAIAIGVSKRLPERDECRDLMALVVDLGPDSSLCGIGAAAVILTEDATLADRVRMLRNHGQDGRVRFTHHVVGFNSRMDEIVAGFLLKRLKGGAL